MIFECLGLAGLEKMPSSAQVMYFSWESLLPVNFKYLYVCGWTLPLDTFSTLHLCSVETNSSALKNGMIEGICGLKYELEVTLMGC